MVVVLYSQDKWKLAQQSAAAENTLYSYLYTCLYKPAGDIRINYCIFFCSTVH